VPPAAIASPGEVGALEAPPTLDGEAQLRVRRWGLVLGVLGAGSLLGVAFSPYLVTHWPLLLVGLSPLGRHMVLVAPVTNPVAFFLVLVVRRLLFYLACFQLGRALGPWAIPWVESRSRLFGRFLRLLERLFNRAPHAVVLVMSGPSVSALAGVSTMRLEAFVPLATLSLAARVLLVMGLATWLRVYVEIVLAWIDAHWIPATAVTLTGVVLYQVYRRWRSAPR
jgi:membrane protein DedA with SNARE-associated domain